MKTSRVVAMIIGCVLMLPGLGVFLGGGALGSGYLTQRDSDGYFEETLEPFETQTVAITAEDVDLDSSSGATDRFLDALDAEVRLRVTNRLAGQEVFVGIARQADLDRYLAGVAHDKITDVNDDLEPVFEAEPGSLEIEPPASQDIWVESASGIGRSEINWEPTSGRWAAVLMNADGSPGVQAEVNVGAKADILVPIIWTMLGVGAALVVLASSLILFGAMGRRRSDPVFGDLIAEDPIAEDPIARDSDPSAVKRSVVGSPDTPVVLTAELQPGLSRWQWLVKWILAVPHFIILMFLWCAFGVLTLIAGVAILFTGRYPRSIFDFNVGVLRWAWRVSYYATSGGLGTDEYPPFSLHPEPGDHARLDIAYPKQLSRGLVLVKWLLAIPHLLIVAILAGTSLGWELFGDNGFSVNPTAGGLLSLLALAAGLILLINGRYPQALFDLIVGLNRWIYRVIAYVALMTDDYPPFRLDQGGSEPTNTPPTGPSRPPRPEAGWANREEPVPVDAA